MAWPHALCCVPAQVRAVLIKWEAGLPTHYEIRTREGPGYAERFTLALAEPVIPVHPGWKASILPDQPPASAMRFVFPERATVYGISLWELRVCGEAVGQPQSPPPPATPLPPAIPPMPKPPLLPPQPRPWWMPVPSSPNLPPLLPPPLPHDCTRLGIKCDRDGDNGAGSHLSSHHVTSRDEPDAPPPPPKPRPPPFLPPPPPPPRADHGLHASPQPPPRVPTSVAGLRGPLHGGSSLAGGGEESDGGDSTGMSRMHDEEEGEGEDLGSMLPIVQGAVAGLVAGLVVCSVGMVLSMLRTRTGKTIAAFEGGADEDDEDEDDGLLAQEEASIRKGNRRMGTKRQTMYTMDDGDDALISKHAGVVAKESRRYASGMKALEPDALSVEPAQPPTTSSQLLSARFQRIQKMTETVVVPLAAPSASASDDRSPGQTKSTPSVTCKFIWQGRRCEVQLPVHLGHPASVQAFVKDLSKQGSALLDCTLKPSTMRVEYKVLDRLTGTKRRVHLTPTSSLSELFLAESFLVTAFDS